MKKIRQSLEFRTIFKGSEISCLSCMDNRVVTLMSTFIGELPVKTIKRFDKKLKQSVQLPNVIIQCNKHMGRVDLLSSNIGRYKNKM